MRSIFLLMNSTLVSSNCLRSSLRLRSFIDWCSNVRSTAEEMMSRSTHFIDMHGREAGQIDALGLNELQQERKQLAAAFEDLGPVQDAPVGPDDLPLEVVRLGIEG